VYSAREQVFVSVEKPPASTLHCQDCERLGQGWCTASQVQLVTSAPGEEDAFEDICVNADS